MHDLSPGQEVTVSGHPAEVGAMAADLGPEAHAAARSSWSCYDPRKSLPCGECRACAASERSGIRAIGGADA